MRKKIIIAIFCVAIIAFIGAVPAEAGFIRDGVHTPQFTELAIIDRGELADMRAVANYETPETGFDLTEGERDLILRVTMAEAGDQDLIGKALTICVIFNRVASSEEWPDTIEGVIYQSGQFETVSNGAIWRCVPNAECEEALEMVLNGWDESGGAIYFCMDYLDFSGWANYMFTHGTHRFYSEKG